MKSRGSMGRKPTALPVAWREAEYAALKVIAEDNCDDRVSENIFDVEDERAEVDSIHQRLAYESH